MKYTYEEYADGVISGKIIAGELIKLACERYKKDQLQAFEKGFSLDRQAGERAIRFISSLKQTKGVYAGQPLTLQPWQQFLIFNIFAWKKADGSRRYRKAYIEVARKNGKSTLAAGIGLCGLFVDKEPRAEVYSAATTKDQAKIVFEEAKEMVKNCSLKQRIAIFRNSLSYDSAGSYFKPLSADYDTMLTPLPECSMCWIPPPVPGEIHFFSSSPQLASVGTTPAMLTEGTQSMS